MSQELLQACSFFAILTQPELGLYGEDPAWGTPTASTTQAWCPLPWVQAREGRCWELRRGVQHLVMTSIYMSFYNKRERDADTDACWCASLFGCPPYICFC